MRQFIGAFLSTFLQWYAFFLFSQLSFFVFPIYIFVIGFIFRVIGGLFFGYIGDKISRRTALISVNLILSAFSLLLFFFPNKASLVLYRVVQGLTLGGEWGGASTVLIETYSSSRYRGFISSIIQLTVPIAIIFSSISIFLVYEIGEEAWKIFLVPISILSLITIPLLRDISNVRGSSFPLVEAVKEDWRNIMKAIGIKISESAIFYVFTTYVFSTGKVALLVSLAVIIQLFTMPFFGYLTDIIGRKKVVYLGVSLMVISTFFFPNTIGEIIMSISDSALYAPQASIFTETFKKKYRYTASSLSYQLASLIGGVIPPILLSDIKPLFVLIPYAIITLISLYFVQETRGKKLE